MGALLIAFSAGVGAVLSWMLGIDALTAYLATSPGAMETVAIIAASSHVDVPFIIAPQIVRFVTIIAIGRRALWSICDAWYAVH